MRDLTVPVLIAFSGGVAITAAFCLLRRGRSAVWPSTMELSTVLAAGATWAGLAVAAWGVWQLQTDLTQVMQAEVSMRLDQQFDSTEMRRARRALAKELLEQRATISETRVLEFFEKVSLYEDLHRVDEESVYMSFSYYVERYWVASKSFVEDFRKGQSDNEFYEGLEELSRTMLAIDAKKKHRPESSVVPTSKEVLRFLKEEAELAL